MKTTDDGKFGIFEIKVPIAIANKLVSMDEMYGMSVEERLVTILRFFFSSRIK